MIRIHLNVSRSEESGGIESDEALISSELKSTII